MSSTWNPTAFVRVIDALDTSMGTCLVKTDAGEAYLKVISDRESPHHLACEWVGTHLARWLGLETFDVALLHIHGDDGIELRGGYLAKSGPAFVARREQGFPWGGQISELADLANSADIGRLVVFDTWIRNIDRCPPEGSTRPPNLGNVFLSNERCAPGKPGCEP